VQQLLGKGRRHEAPVHRKIVAELCFTF
jgi:hypothetical protein